MSKRGNKSKLSVIVRTMHRLGAKPPEMQIRAGPSQRKYLRMDRLVTCLMPHHYLPEHT